MAGGKLSASRVLFALIDADGVRGYYVVAFNKAADGNARHEVMRAINKINAKLQIQMNREYLTRLKKLQDEIAFKYTNLMDQTNEGAEEDPLTLQEWEEEEKRAEEHFPGEEAEWYG